MNKEEKLNIFIGTHNSIKVRATKEVFEEFFPSKKIIIHQMKVPSEVSPQPFSLPEVIKGSENRALNALKMINRKEDKYFSVGIEAGLVKIPSTITGYLDFQYCTIIDAEGNKSLGTGPGWEYPPHFIEKIKSDPSIEIGDLMGEKSGNKNIKYQEGSIGYFSKGHLNRLNLTKVAIKMALIPFLNHKEYFK